MTSRAPSRKSKDSPLSVCAAFLVTRSSRKSARLEEVREAQPGIQRSSKWCIARFNILEKRDVLRAFQGEPTGIGPTLSTAIEKWIEFRDSAELRLELFMRAPASANAFQTGSLPGRGGRTAASNREFAANSAAFLLFTPRMRGCDIKYVGVREHQQGHHHASALIHQLQCDTRSGGIIRVDEAACRGLVSALLFLRNGFYASDEISTRDFVPVDKLKEGKPSQVSFEWRKDDHKLLRVWRLHDRKLGATRKIRTTTLLTIARDLDRIVKLAIRKAPARMILSTYRVSYFFYNISKKLKCFQNCPMRYGR